MTAVCLTMSVSLNMPESFIQTHSTSLIGLKSLKMEFVLVAVILSAKTINSFVQNVNKIDFLILLEVFSITSMGCFYPHVTKSNDLKKFMLRLLRRLVRHSVS